MQVTTRFPKVVVWVWVCFAFSYTAAFADDAAERLIRAQLERHRLEHEREELVLRVTKKNGNVKEREMVRFAEVKPDGSMSMMAILTQPDGVKGTGVLFMFDAATGSSGQWLYLPAIRMVKTIGEGGKKNNFMGTDFAYEDMRPLDLDAVDLRSVGPERLGDHDCLVVDVVPATDAERDESGYAKRRIWIREDNLMTVKTEFFDATGEVIKVWINEGLVEVAPQVWRADRMIMTSTKKDRQTELIVRSRDTETPFEDGFFSQERLKGWLDQ